jgi:hypothetical protein
MSGIVGILNLRDEQSMRSLAVGSRSPYRRIRLLALLIPCVGTDVLAQTVSELPARYWPAFPLPERVVLGESYNEVNEAVRVLLNTVSGLVAYDTRCKGSGEMVWIGLTNSPSHDTWLTAYLKRNSAPCEAFAKEAVVLRMIADGNMKGAKTGNRHAFQRAEKRVSPAFSLDRVISQMPPCDKRVITTLHL